MANQYKQYILGWTAFNANMDTTEVPITTVSNLLFTQAPPTDLDTIYTTLLKLVQIAGIVGQEHIFVTADFAI